MRCFGVNHNMSQNMRFLCYHFCLIFVSVLFVTLFPSLGEPLGRKHPWELLGMGWFLELLANHRRGFGWKNCCANHAIFSSKSHNFARSSNIQDAKTFKYSFPKPVWGSVDGVTVQTTPRLPFREEQKVEKDFIWGLEKRKRIQIEPL